MLLYELNHREQSSAFESKPLKTMVAELGHTKSSASSRHLLRRCVAHALVGLVILSTVGGASAQDQSRSWRLTYQDRTAKTNPVAIHFETRPQAEAWQQNLMQDNASSKGLGLAPNYSDFRIEQVAQKSERADQETAISFAGEAIRALRGRMQKGSGRLGDTLRDYANVVKGSLKNANQLRSTLLSMTGNIERKTFDQINQRIDDFNKQAEGYNQIVTSPDTILRLQRENGGKIVGPQDYPKIDMVASVRPDQLKGVLVKDAKSSETATTMPKPLKAATLSLAGTVWVSDDTTITTQYTFLASRKVLRVETWLSSEGMQVTYKTEADWSQTGDKVKFDFFLGRTGDFAGTVSGNQMEGICNYRGSISKWTAKQK